MSTDAQWGGSPAGSGRRLAPPAEPGDEWRILTITFKDYAPGADLPTKLFDSRNGFSWRDAEAGLEVWTVGKDAVAYLFPWHTIVQRTVQHRAKP